MVFLAACRAAIVGFFVAMTMALSSSSELAAFLGTVGGVLYATAGVPPVAGGKSSGIKNY